MRLLVFLLLASVCWAEGVTRAIQFEPGAYSAVIDGAVIRGDRDNYTIEASKGQKIWIRLTSLEGNAVFDLYSPGGEPLGEPESRTLEGRLPASGVYRIQVSGTRGNATYELKVTIR